MLRNLIPYVVGGPDRRLLSPSLPAAFGGSFPFFAIATIIRSFVGGGVVEIAAIEV
jgi:hypothetical protein